MTLRPIASFALAAVLAAATAAAAYRLNVAQARPYDVAIVPSATAMRWVSLGHPTIAANMTWLRTVQYIGEPRAAERGWSRLRPLLELVTDLDPRHAYAYQVGANALSSAGLVDDANAILEKGIRNVPDRYILKFHRAANAFMYQQDYATAGRYFELAASTPGAPPHLREYVLSMYVKGDREEAAIGFLRHLADTAEDDESRKAIGEQLRRAVLERNAKQLERAVARWRARWVLGPFAASHLVDAGLVPELPPEPYGGAWYVDPDGTVRSTLGPKRIPRPTAAELDGAANLEKLRAVEHAMEEQVR